MKKKILFTGYYGQHNIGDDLFGLVSIWGAKKYWNYSNTMLLAHEGPVSRYININYALASTQKFRGQYRIESYYKILFASYCILSGGSILNTMPKNGSQRKLMFDLAKLGITKLGAIGVSVGPFKSEVHLKKIGNALRHFKFLALRDRSSLEIANSFDLPYKPILSADLAFLLPKMTKEIFPPIVPQKNTLGISVCHYERYVNGDLTNEKRREDGIYETLRILATNKNILFRFFVFNNSRTNGDGDYTKELIKRLSLQNNRVEIIEYSKDTLRIYQKLSECATVFSTRLHGAILAAAGNVPSILVEYHKKCSDYLDDIEVDNKWRIGDMKILPTEVADLLINLLYNESSTFYPNRQQMIAFAEKNFCSVIVKK